MSPRTTPPFRADHVGSLLRPPELHQAREARARNAISAADLARAEDEAIRGAVKLQEELGLKSITDGEYRRGSWNQDFLQSFSGVEVVQGRITVRFHSQEGALEGRPTGFRIVGKLGRPRGIFVEAFKFLKSVAHATPKVTIPSPTLLHFRGGREAIDRTTYPDMAGFYADLARVYAEEIADLAAAGCRYLQIDETNFAYLCDPSLRQQVQSNIGEDPAALPLTYAKLLNQAIAGRPKDMAVCIHICRGNNQSAWVAEGGYEPVAEVLFNAIDVDGYFLEYDTPRAGDFAPLRHLPKGKIAVLGLLTTKLPQLESKDELKRRIDEAARYAPLDQLALSPQCGFASVAQGNKITVADEIAKLRRVIEVAGEVWG
ncbi:MAG TPA: 5-methyltetrahydropteroyltriglutamate--homocysteine S-methyltransferase [Stellaceae bacterium]|nr:5-methyltetrahydropteroyltriglutamate--homocysteine S-methyltransferase [Stellaceae bacterium]